MRTSHSIGKADVKGEASAWVELERMYESRHRLVHEIRHDQIGHYPLRETIPIEEALRIGRLVEGCMHRVEGVLAAHAPRDFPNVLSAKGYPTSERERLREDIEAVEGRLQAHAVVDAEDLSGAGLDLSGLDPAVQAGRRHVEAELDWLREFRPAGSRYHDFAEELETSLLRGRLAYLRDVEEAIGAA